MYSDAPSHETGSPNDHGGSPAPGTNDARFAEVLSLLQRRVKRPVFDSWFARLSFLDADEDVIRIATTNQLAKPWIEENAHLLQELALAVRAAFGAALTPEIVVVARDLGDGLEPDDEGAAGQPSGSVRDARPSPPPPRRSAIDPDSTVQLKDEFTFDTYVVGPTSNALAHAAANAVVKDPGRQFNPLFVHSAVGLGKTHLLQATCHELLHRSPRPRILFLSCEQFLNRYVSAINDKALESFRTKHRSVDVLVIDDIHFLAEKPQFQEEFFHTFNALHNAQKQIILSADCQPSEIPTLENRLVSRFSSGLVTKIDPPEFETRCAIIKRKAEQRGHPLDDEVIHLIAQRIDSNIRQIEGALNRLIGTASLSNARIDRAFARTALADLFVDDGAHVHIHDIIEAVVSKLRVKTNDLQSRRRTKKIAFARHICMHLAREMTDLTLADIGGHLGGRDHTSVIYALEKIEGQLTEDPELKAQIEELKRDVRTRRPSG